ncbi:HelD family protein [Paenibacillus hamazuiensis]|uniref:HelD family protein n=1 Tax=Paenibacillus hamazuiensis TaxID=2936508 RepID=UPI0020102B1D|nr:UvrD-helicase domain-containing protein [Paenibacillus hamazuiensis]
MLNRTETEERQYLNAVLAKLQRALDELERQVSSSYREVIEAKKYVWQNMSQLDPAERAANRVDISLAIDSGNRAIAQRTKIQKLLQSPYFGRVDFAPGDKAKTEQFYIGIHSFADDNDADLIYDWRSPVSSMFYDFEAGKAFYEAPMGTVEGEIKLKRQYKIKNGEMEYMLESSMNISDDVLQKELSQTTDEKMKNIVATIQKEQNVIIRNETSSELIIQGVAGSGKTSIALHRVAFLLYRNKETLTSRNVLIISPNKVFSDYISGVLPELGEEKIMEVGFEELAARELAGICKFQTFYEQVAELIEQGDDRFAERIGYKATVRFTDELEAYLQYADEHFFEAKDFELNGTVFSRGDILNGYNSLKRLPAAQRWDKLAASLAAGRRDKEGNKLNNSSVKKIKTAVKKMYRFQDALSLYKHFYEHIGKPELFQWKGPKTLEYADVFPLVYVKFYYEGAAAYDQVKHLLVDEMQDYTPVQYAVLAKWFPCKKTILGDSGQSVNPYSSSSLTIIKKVFPHADTIELCRSYRSTVEITNFAQSIKKNDKLIPIERHGEPPVIARCGGRAGELAEISRLVGLVATSGYQSLGIICKTQKEAERVYAEMNQLYPDIDLLDFHSEQFRSGIIVACAHLAKGLEFDQVIVPFADQANYRTELDRSLLYIACTRATHKLNVTYSGEPSSFLGNDADSSK